MANRPRRWRLVSAAKIGAAIGLAITALNALSHNLPITGGDIAGIVVGWPFVAALFAAARNSILPRDG